MTLTVSSAGNCNLPVTINTSNTPCQTLQVEHNRKLLTQRNGWIDRSPEGQTDSQAGRQATMGSWVELFYWPWVVQASITEGYIKSNFAEKYVLLVLLPKPKQPVL